MSGAAQPARTISGRKNPIAKKVRAKRVIRDCPCTERPLGSKFRPATAALPSLARLPDILAAARKRARGDLPRRPGLVLSFTEGTMNIKGLATAIGGSFDSAHRRWRRRPFGRKLAF